ncbi:MAG: hypothetical protein N3E47_05295, partial [Candidatus Bathyarchaeota archaeon]|nr:hypothetical protein [Candidatus Bathyarchaeota archaeon]
MNSSSGALKRVEERQNPFNSRGTSPSLIFVIEHLEPEVGKWLYLEYANASSIVGKDRLTFTNVKRGEDAEILSGLGRVRCESFIEIFSPERIVILDPKAPERLKPDDFTGKE